MVVPALYQRDITKLKVPLPSIKEQISISDTIYSLDTKIQLNHKTNKILRQILRAMFKQWFTSFNFPNNEGEGGTNYQWRS